METYELCMRTLRSTAVLPTLQFCFLQNMLDEHLIKSTDNEAEGKVFYLKMKGDYFRYMCEVESGDARKGRHD